MTEKEKNVEIVFHDERTIKTEPENVNKVEENKNDIKIDLAHGAEAKTFMGGLEISEYLNNIQNSQTDLLAKIDFLNNKIAELEQKSVLNENKGNKKLEGV